MERVYLDHNSTSPLRPEVRELLQELLARPLGNASSLHASGRAARDLVDRAREQTARALGVEEDEVVFTSGGTESNCLALLGASGGPPKVVAASRVEHSSVLGVLEGLRARGTPCELLDVDRAGRVRLERLTALAEGAGPGLLSLQAANNEVGTRQPVERAAAIVHARGGLVHTDAVQALGRVALPLGRGADAVDLASLSAHKIGGPQGVGVLYVRRGTPLEPLVRSGAQEAGLRAGTENAAAIAAAALAISIATRDAESHAARMRALAERLWTDVSGAFPDAELLGPSFAEGDRLPNTLAVSFPETDGKVLVTALDLAGLEVSSGSACASGSVEPSHVLLAMGRGEDEARAAVRLSLGWSTTAADCERAVDTLRKVVSASRASRGSFPSL